MGLFGGSGKGPRDRSDVKERSYFASATTRRVVDKEAGVVLYGAQTADNSFGLAAVPIDDTNLTITEHDAVVPEDELENSGQNRE